MSIINEALKKAGNEKKQSLGTVSMATVAQSARKNLELEHARRRSRINWGPIFVVLVLLLITGPIIAPAFSTPFKHISAQDYAAAPAGSSVQLASAPVAENRKGQFGIEEMPAFSPAMSAAVINRTPNLNLTGLVYSAEDSYALINQKVVRVGEMVRGAKLIGVTAQAATLDYQGNELTLRLEE